MPNEAWGSIEAGAIPCRVPSSLDTGIKQGPELPGLPALFASQLGGEYDFRPASSFSPEHLLPVALVCISSGPGQITPFTLLAGGGWWWGGILLPPSDSLSTFLQLQGKAGLA